MAKHHGKGMNERVSAGKAQFEKLHGGTPSPEKSSSPASEGVPMPKAAHRSPPPPAPVIQPKNPPGQAPGGLRGNMGGPQSGGGDSDYDD
jgi:hypothetical protein